MDTHDDSHFFVVFKAEVNMDTFIEHFNQTENSDPRPPIIPYPVYLSWTETMYLLLDTVDRVVLVYNGDGHGNTNDG